ncbi:DNA-binding SAP [Fusarium albosuccineum]|uniref:DNA-binding SAP n=1 Tax=Fusarium albosuccineum TaxID=1237068 RepID=A0A8H4LH86_9HYPO|nr:DNA-binding SAP [Fusarium albosuccineum]
MPLSSEHTWKSSLVAKCSAVVVRPTALGADEANTGNSKAIDFANKEPSSRPAKIQASSPKPRICPSPISSPFHLALFRIPAPALTRSQSLSQLHPSSLFSYPNSTALPRSSRAMAEYSSLKVPELKKLLAEKGLPQTGNKADLIARLQENDKKAESEAQPAENKEDEISYSDDEAPAEAAAPAAAAPAPATEAPAPEAAPAATDKAEEPAEEKPAESEAAPAEPEKSYAIGLSSTAADDEAKKRADRAKRFGLEEDDDAKKRADRAKRFGLDEKELASTLDSALPERSRKRGRGRGEGEAEGNRPGKRQSLDRRNDRRRGRGGRNGRDGRDGPRRDGPATRGGILNDPTEKAKAEKRAARFAGN